MKIEYINSFFEKHKHKKHSKLEDGTLTNSQNGEEVLLEKIFDRLNINAGWLCEFGAWDGKHLSNTFNLVKKGFNAVYIEGNKDRYKDLLETVKEYPNIIPINAFVDHHNTKNSLDNLLKRTNIPIDFDAVSIDVDSYDYQIWKSLKIYKPKIVIIEINSSISPLNTNHIHKLPKYQGTSFLPMLRLGIGKGYKFLFHTGNMFFVREDYWGPIQFISARDHYLENYRRKWFPQEINI